MTLKFNPFTSNFQIIIINIIIQVSQVVRRKKIATVDSYKHLKSQSKNSKI